MTKEKTKIYMTEFKIEDSVYEGPYIYASTFEEADLEAELLGFVIVGEVRLTYTDSNEQEKERVLH